MVKPARSIVKDIENQVDRLTAAQSSAYSDDIFLSVLDSQHDFALQDEQSRLHAELEDTVLTLADYLNAVQLVINETFAHSVWVKSEIRSLSSKGGHYYFELADKDSDGKITASCRGNLWRGQATRLLTKFEKNTGMSLERGLNVLLKVTATFHPQYGFSVNILDIDPTYTLGDLAKQYQLMVQKLHDEGLLDLNKSLPAPFDIEHVLVIAPENAAGLGDFRADADILSKTAACYFHYQHATFQGNHAPDEIRAAIIKGLHTLQSQNITPDIIVIIRGGGAVGDLAYLNDYELAALVAEQPIPVWVGIGHERDHVILDEVAQISFDTPSKVIAGIRQQLINITQTAKQNFLNIEQIAQASLMQARRMAEQQLARLQTDAQRQLTAAKLTIDGQFMLTKQQAFQHIKHARQQTAQFRELILLQHPARVLEQGYAIIRKPNLTNQSTIITSVTQINHDEIIVVELKDGQIQAQIDTIYPNTAVNHDHSHTSN